MWKRIYDGEKNGEMSVYFIMNSRSRSIYAFKF